MIMETSKSNKDFVKPSAATLAHDLSKREKEILILLMQGKTSRDIGDALFISKFTVDVHRKNMLRKTGSASTTELTMKVMQQTFGLSAFTLSVL